MNNILQSSYLKKYLVASVILIAITALITACIPPARPPLGNSTLSIGVLLTNNSSAGNYEDLKAYLEKELRPRLNPIQVQIDAARYSLQELRNNIISKKWDIVFTVSPAISVVAEDNGYEFIARMYPNNEPYFESTIFVRRNDNSIQGLNDITSDKTIALGAFDNIPAFYMPIYDLYGKTVRVKQYNSLDEIIKKVESGEADVGAGVYSIIINNPRLRTLNGSRVIPVAGVYLSPTDRINKKEYGLIKRAFLNAPLEIQKKANYIKSNKLDYKPLKKIAATVERVIECSDWTRNPVKLSCGKERVAETKNQPIPPDILSGKVRGEVNGFRRINFEKIGLTLQGEDGKVYNVIIYQNVLNQVPNAPPLPGLNRKTIEVINAERKEISGTIELQVTKPAQLKIL